MNIVEAVERSDISAFERFVSENPISITKKNHVGESQLHIAANNGCAHIIEILLGNGIDANVTNKWRHAPLHFACREGRYKAAEILIGHGARVDLKNNNGWTPLHYASKGGHSEVIKLLLVYGADVNAVDNDGDTALYNAAFWNKFDAVKVLLSYAADKSIQNKRGKTAYDKAKNKGYNNIAKYIEHFLLCDVSGSVTFDADECSGLDVASNCDFSKVSDGVTKISLESDQSEIGSLLKDKEDLHQRNCERKKINDIELKKRMDEVSRIRISLQENYNIIETATKKHQQLTSDQQEAEKEYNVTMQKALNLDKECQESADQIAEIKRTLEVYSVTDKELENYHQCPICFEELNPTLKIFQCPEGHICCETCKNKPEMELCPQCRKPMKGLDIRNRALEDIIQIKYSSSYASM